MDLFCHLPHFFPAKLFVRCFLVQAGRGKFFLSFYCQVQGVLFQNGALVNAYQIIQKINAVNAAKVHVFPVDFFIDPHEDFFQLATYILISCQEKLGAAYGSALVLGVFLVDFLENVIHITESLYNFVQVAVGQLPSVFQGYLTDGGNFRRCFFQKRFVVASFFQAFHNFRAELGYVVRGQQAVVGFIHNVGDVVVKQGVHDLGNCAVPGEIIDVVFDVGVQVFQACDQVIGVFPDLHEHDTWLVHGAFYQAVDSVNVALVFDLFAVCDVQESFDYFDRVFFEVYALHVAFVGFHFDPAVVFQAAQNAVCPASAVVCLEFFFHQLGCIFLVKIEFQLVYQHFSFYAEGELVFHDGKKAADAFPVYDSVRGGQGDKKVVRNYVKHRRCPFFKRKTRGKLLCP